MKIIIGGDVCPMNSNLAFFEESNNQVFGELQGYFDNADLAIVNLEVPLTQNQDKILKSGANIKGNVKAASTLKKSNVNLVSLANNHIGDFGEQGVIDTINNCINANLKFVGAGNDINEAKQPVFFKGDVKAVVLSYSDIEFGMAKKNKAGANPFDIKQTTKDILAVKDQADYIIVILHEGKEYYEYPSPDLQKTCRYICDIGADLVVCQHSHVIGAWEKYNGSDIFYGQGNLLFDFADRNSISWTRGYLVAIEINPKDCNIELIPFKQTFPGIIPLNQQERTEFNNKMKLLSINTLNEQFIEENWKNYIKKLEATYFSIFRGHGKFQRKFFSFFPFYKYLYNSKKYAILLNVIRSRVHREVIIDILEQKIKI